MAPEIKNNINDVFLETLKSNLNYWVGKELDIPKLDQANLRRVVKFGLECEETFAIALRLTVQSMRLIEKRGDSFDWLKIFEVDTLNIHNGQAHEKVKILNIKGQLAYLSGLFKKSIFIFEQAVDHYESLDDIEVLIQSYLGLCQAEWALGHFCLAKKYGDKVLSIFEKYPENLFAIAKVYNLFGMISVSENKNKEAWGYFQKSKKIYTKIKDKVGQIHVENNLAILELYNSNYKESLKRFNIVINFFAKTESEIELIQAKVSRGLLFYKMGKLKESKLALRNAIPSSWRNSSSEYHQAWVNLIFGYMELSQKKMSSFKFYLAKSLEFWEIVGNQKMIVHIKKELKRY